MVDPFLNRYVQSYLLLPVQRHLTSTTRDFTMSIKIQRNLTIPTKLKQTSWTVAAFFAACLLVPSGYVMAQDDSEIEFGAVLEEVLVTSRRYEERIEDAPLSVNVLDGEYLNAQGVANLNDIIELTPGATWAHFTMAQPGFTLRGMES